jgi:hypothetical protein
VIVKSFALETTPAISEPPLDRDAILHAAAEWVTVCLERRAD